MQPILKIGLTKSGISSTLQTAVRYGPWSLGGIGLFYPFVIQGTGTIAFLIEHYWKSTPSSPLLRANLSTLQLESGRGGVHIIKLIHINSTMATDRVLDTRGMEIHVRKPNQHLSPSTITMNTAHE